MAVDLSLGFPLLNSLAVADLDLKAEASLTRFSLQDAIGDVDLTDATARVKYGNSELAVSGTGKLDGSAVEIGWRELFGAKAPFRRRYELKGTVPTALIAKAGFPSPEPYLSGPLGTTLVVPGGDQRDERAGRPLRHQGGQGRRGAARLDQAARRRGPDHRRP